MIETQPASTQTLDRLCAHVEGLDDQDLCDGIAARTVAARRAEAEDAVWLVRLHERICEVNGGWVSAAHAEIGLMLGVSTRSAEHKAGVAYELTARPVVWQGLYDGIVDSIKARKIVSMLEDVPDPQREDMERVALGYATTHTAAQLHKKLLRMTCDEDPEEKMRDEAIDRRSVSLIPSGHGMAWISIYVSAEHANAFMDGVDALADADACPDPYGQGDARSQDQRRADALAGFIEDHSFWDVDIQVVIPADMLMGVETKGANLNGSPVTHALAVELAWCPDARWTRLVTDPLTGVLLDAGNAKYEIPKKTRDAIRLRDLTCRFPGCTKPAEFTDTDHVIPFRASGWTAPAGLACLCRHHHRIKTFANWRVHQQGDTLVWQTRFGTTATTRPHDYRNRCQRD